MADYQSQLTQIYDKLSAINGSLAQLALMSSVNTIQADLQSRLNIISGRLSTVTTDIEDLQLTMSDLIVELRSI